WHQRVRRDCRFRILLTGLRHNLSSAPVFLHTVFGFSPSIAGKGCFRRYPRAVRGGGEGVFPDHLRSLIWQLNPRRHDKRKYYNSFVPSVYRQQYLARADYIPSDNSFVPFVRVGNSIATYAPQIALRFAKANNLFYPMPPEKFDK